MGGGWLRCLAPRKGLYSPRRLAQPNCLDEWAVAGRAARIWQEASPRRRCLPNPRALDGQNASACGSRPTSERPVWLAKSAPSVKIGSGSHGDDVERPDRVRSRDLASTLPAVAIARRTPHHTTIARPFKRDVMDVRAPRAFWWFGVAWRYPEVASNCALLKPTGRRQRDTAVTDAQTRQPNPRPSNT